MTKVSDLEGADLDYWVAKAGKCWEWASGLYPTMTLDSTFSGIRIGEWPRGEYGALMPTAVLIPNNPMRQDPKPFCPSSVWEHGGPIIEREKIQLKGSHNQWRNPPWLWTAWPDVDGVGPNANGRCHSSPLVAAMRAYVASKFGDEVSE